MLRVSGLPHPQYRNTIFLGGGFLLSLLSATLFSRFLVFGVWPDVVTLYALFLTLYGNGRGRYVPCMALGLMRDMLSAGPIGTYAILYGVMHRLIAPRRKSLYRDNPFTLALLAVGVVAALNLSYHFSMVFIGAGIGWSSALSRGLLIGIVSGPLMPLLSWLMKSMFRRFGIERLPCGAYNV